MAIPKKSDGLLSLSLDAFPPSYWTTAGDVAAGLEVPMAPEATLKMRTQ